MIGAVLVFALSAVAAPPANACVGMTEALTTPLDEDSFNAWVDVKFKGRRALLSRGPVALRFASGTVAMRVENAVDGFRVVGVSPRGETLASGEVDRDGRARGNWTFFDDGGVTTWIVSFSRGEATSERCAGRASVSQDGALISLSCTAATGATRDGYAEVRDLAGALRMAGRYANGKRVGFWKNFSIWGCMETMESLVDGQRHGAFYRWHPDGPSTGEPAVRGQYDSGFPTGSWDYWCGGSRKRAEYDPSMRAQEVLSFDSCGPPALPVRFGHGGAP